MRLRLAENALSPLTDTFEHLYFVDLTNHETDGVIYDGYVIALPKSCKTLVGWRAWKNGSHIFTDVSTMIHIEPDADCQITIDQNVADMIARQLMEQKLW